VPVISRFFGIIVRMYYQDHEAGHFHAVYQGEQAKFDFSGVLLVGQITSGTARRLIRGGLSFIGTNSRRIGNA